MTFSSCPKCDYDKALVIDVFVTWLSCPRCNSIFLNDGYTWVEQKKENK